MTPALVEELAELSRTGGTFGAAEVADEGTRR